MLSVVSLFGLLFRLFLVFVGFLFGFFSLSALIFCHSFLKELSAFGELLGFLGRKSRIFWFAGFQLIEKYLCDKVSCVPPLVAGENIPWAVLGRGLVYDLVEAFEV